MMNKRQRKKLYTKLRRHKKLTLRERIIAINYGCKELLRREERKRPVIIYDEEAFRPVVSIGSDNYFKSKFELEPEKRIRSIICDELTEWTVNNYNLIGIDLGSPRGDFTAIHKPGPNRNDAVDALTYAYEADRKD